VDKIELAEWGIIIMILICIFSVIIDFIDEKGWFDID